MQAKINQGKRHHLPDKNTTKTRLMTYGGSFQAGDKVEISSENIGANQGRGIATKLAISKMQIDFLSGKVGLEFCLKNKLGSQRPCSFLNTVQKSSKKSKLGTRDSSNQRPQSAHSRKQESSRNDGDQYDKDQSESILGTRIDFLSATRSGNRSDPKQTLLTSSQLKANHIDTIPTLENWKTRDLSVASKNSCQINDKENSARRSFLNSNLTLTPNHDELIFLTEQGFAQKASEGDHFSRIKYFLQSNSRPRLNSNGEKFELDQQALTHTSVKLDLPKSSSKLNRRQNSICSSQGRRKSLKNSIGSKFLHQFKMPGTMLFERRTNLLSNLTRDLR